MNKQFIGLLLVAAVGAGIFLYLNQKNNIADTPVINKELLVGKWQTHSGLLARDSLKNLYIFDVAKDGRIFHSSADSIPDTLQYKWGEYNQLQLRSSTADSLAEIMTVVQLTKDTLLIHDADSSITVFTRSR